MSCTRRIQRQESIGRHGRAKEKEFVQRARIPESRLMSRYQPSGLLNKIRASQTDRRGDVTAPGTALRSNANYTDASIKRWKHGRYWSTSPREAGRLDEYERGRELCPTSHVALAGPAISPRKRKKISAGGSVSRTGPTRNKKFGTVCRCFLAGACVKFH